ncbi:E3 ubiquitin-protein ligase MBR2 [Syzygium oleosum]|uniref:E3 ubiquitin-protein ligase MBR2 n=1 Tax=Syzygium oleosum TaxID=219896 RepID=UPI0024B8C940|nr:E3 ubiquitin-protein ligase MBR2 [Syzygium oleosum]XP_056174670.1 E3 ubiquitin-protein ligase MBR2 [Syzygium oleosum]XP_056174671.1 E3 ubiquitin-protein ligase MBR2 [Syzygium oleosum]
MDEFSGERALHKFSAPSRGSSLVMRDTASSRARKAQICSRLGCSSRLNAVGTQTACVDKCRYTRPSLRSLTSGKEIVGSSSRSNMSASSQRKSFVDRQKKSSSQLDSDSSETSSVHDEPDVPEVNPPPGKIQRGADFREVVPTEMGSSSAASSSRSIDNNSLDISSDKTDSPTNSSVSMASRSINQPARTNLSRCGLRNIRCNSAANVIPSNGPPSNPTPNRKKDVIKKSNVEGEASSSTRGKNVGRPPLEGQFSSSEPGISISESRRARCRALNRDSGVTSLRTQRSNNYAEPRGSYQGNLSRSRNRSRVMTMQAHQSPIAAENASSSHCDFSVESASGRASTYSRPSSSSESSRRAIPSGLAEIGISRSLMNQDRFQHYNMDGIAEVLLALERIEQDEELTYEQLIALETNLFLNGMNFYDQHRDMRLDIDNMSYEDLLALEERMGTVSTALTEESLVKCIKKELYHPTASASGQNDDVKCSICQEEYVAGDELGRLACEHVYHVSCIQQWLRLKNWCAICKGSAEPSPSSSPPRLTS